MMPLGRPGPMTDAERFVFDAWGYLIIPDALTPEETQACTEAAERCYADIPKDQWRQLGNTFEKEPAFEALIDHPSVLPKARALFGESFILQSSWCTMVPSGFPGGGFHQDGSSTFEFRRLATPTPLVQLRVGYILTDQWEPGVGNLEMIPGTHNSSVPLPRGAGRDGELASITHVVCGKPGTAVMFHQGVYHRGGPNLQDYSRYIIHMVYAPPWLHRSDRLVNTPEFLARTTPLRRALMGQFEYPEKCMHMPALPFDSVEQGEEA
jgi:hypothetical protein